MNNFTIESARLLARQLCVSCGKNKRQKIVDCLDTDFRISVLEEMSKLMKDMPLELQDTIPPGRIPNCS